MSSVQHPVGSMVWGKLPGYDWWPGVIISYSREEEDSKGDGEEGEGVQVWIKWYGENNLSQVSVHTYTYYVNTCTTLNAHDLELIPTLLSFIAWFIFFIDRN